MSRVSLLAIATASIAAPSTAQSVPTNIIADTALDRSLGTSVSTVGNVTTIDNGTLSGTNLFHSFANFDVGSGDVAQWVFSSGNPNSISNVINRVTGGTHSSIMGVLDSTAIPNADFYFINPAGIVFSGQDAQVNVPAAAHFSTASELHFADGTTLEVATPSGSILLVAAPAAFGFLGAEGDINFVNAGKDWSGDGVHMTPLAGAFHLSAANIGMLFSGLHGASLSLAAVGATEASVTIDGRAEGLQGSINISYSQLDYSVNVPGDALFRAGSLTSYLTNVWQPFYVGGGDGVVDIGLTAGLAFDNTFIRGTGNIFIVADSAEIANTSTIWGGDLEGDGANRIGNIVLTVAGNLQVVGNSQVATQSGSADGGNITISSNALIMDDGSISALSVEGTGGDVGIFVGSVSLSNSSMIESGTVSGTGGQVYLSVAGAMTMDQSTIASNARGGGEGGSVSVEVADHLLLTDASQISANSRGAASAGDVLVAAGSARLEEESAIASNAFRSGSGGLVAMQIAGLLEMDESSITTNSGQKGVIADVGSGGAILVNAGTLAMDQATIASNAFGNGGAGSVGVEVTGTINMRVSDIFSDSYGAGDSGTVSVSAASLIMTSLSSITSDALADGDGGLVVVEIAGPISMSEFSRISSNTGEDGDGTTTGTAGAVVVSATDLMMDSSSIFSESFGDGDSGSVHIDLDGNLRMAESYISSGTNGGMANGGDVTVVAASASLELSSIAADTFGDGDGGSVFVEIANMLSLSDFSYISADTLFGTGDGGDVSVSAHLLNLTLGSFISSDAFGDGDGGSVDVRVGNTISLAGGSKITTSVYGTGNGGFVFVETGTILMSDGSSIASTSSEFATGNAGNVDIHAGLLALTGESEIASDSNGLGSGGSVFVTADEVAMNAASRISTLSLNENPAGLIAIKAGTLSLSGAGTSIASENLNPDEGANSAGLILIEAGHATIADGARVATNSLTGTAGNIDFVMPKGSLLILSGMDLPGVIETSSGSQSGGVISISKPLAIISNGGRISALGSSGGANVQIDTNYFIVSSDRPNTVEVDGTLAFTNAIYDVSAGTVDADLAIADASSVLSNQCSAARASGELSQLQLRSVGPFGSARGQEAKPVEKAVGSSGGCH